MKAYKDMSTEELKDFIGKYEQVLNEAYKNVPFDEYIHNPILGDVPQKWQEFCVKNGIIRYSEDEQGNGNWGICVYKNNEIQYIKLCEKKEALSVLKARRDKAKQYEQQTINNLL